jgi:hypothetical protein
VRRMVPMDIGVGRHSLSLAWNPGEKGVGNQMRVRLVAVMLDLVYTRRIGLL